ASITCPALRAAPHRHSPLRLAATGALPFAVRLVQTGAGMLALLVLAAASSWVPLSKGIEWRNQDGLQVVRVSPDARLDVRMSTRRTAAEWLVASKAPAVINASMFQNDGRTSAGHLHCGALVNQRAWPNEYQSVLAFKPASAALPPFTIVDLDQSGAK